MNSIEIKRNLLGQVRACMIRHEMVQPGFRLIIAVSGGPDSMALLYLLNELKSEFGIGLVVAHLDHGLRPESGREAKFVEEAARQLGIDAEVRRADVCSLAAEAGLSIEETGRRERYAFFEELRVALGARRIATGHHKDDSIETFLLRIFRGSSLTGLGGIHPVRENIIRPLIDLTRSDILAFLKAEGIAYITDPSNFEPDTDRNFIRNRLVPVIRECFPDFARPLKRTLELIGKEELFLEQAAAEVYSAAISETERGLQINVSSIRNAPEALAARAILSVLYELSGSDTRWTRTHLENIIKLLQGQNPSARLDLPNHLTIVREYDRAFLTPKTVGRESAPFEMTVNGPATVRIPEQGMTLEFRILPGASPDFTVFDGRQKAIFDADSVPFPLTIRSPRPGDRFKPWGMKGSRKLKKVLIDQKIPRSMRSGLVLVLKENTILWIPGIRRSSLAPITDQTREALEMRLRYVGGRASRTGAEPQPENGLGRHDQAE